MIREINVRCAGCGNGVFLEGGGPGTCSKCGRGVLAPFLPAPGRPLSGCALCERRDLYRQRDFNRTLGVWIAGVACLGAFVLFLLEHWFLAMGVLSAAALLDLGLYFALAEVVVCYACGAIHRGFVASDSIAGYNLAVADRYEKRTGGPTGGH